MSSQKGLIGEYHPKLSGRNWPKFFLNSLLAVVIAFALVSLVAVFTNILATSSMYLGAVVVVSLLVIGLVFWKTPPRLTASPCMRIVS